MRFLQSALLTIALLFTTGTVQVGEIPESVRLRSISDGHDLIDCCIPPNRGNINCDSEDLVDLSDVVSLIDWMFRGGPEPLCWREANVDGSGCDSSSYETTAEITIADLVYLVEYLFSDGPPPVDMPDPHRWEKTYGGDSYDHGVSVVATSDGGYVAVGSYQHPGTRNSDFYLIKTDAWGDTVWTRTYGDSLCELGYSVALAADGDFIVTGLSSSNCVTSTEIPVLRVSAEGNLIWFKTFGGPRNETGYSVVATADGGCVVAGEIQDSTWHMRPFIMKLNSEGDSLWSSIFEFSATYAPAFSVAITPDGGSVLTGAADGRVFLLRTDSLGDSLWSRLYGDSTFGGSSVLPTEDGGYVLVSTPMDWERDRFYVIKTDSLGETLWSRKFKSQPELQYIRIWTILDDDDGGYVISGTVDKRFDDGDDPCLIKLDSVGNEVWLRTYGEGCYDSGNMAAKTADGGFVIVGRQQSCPGNSGGSNVYLIKTDSLGYSQSLTG